MKNWKKTMMFLLACTLVFSAFLPLGVSAADNAKVNAFYIAPDGNDQNDGSINSPFATLEAARDAVRKLKNGSGIPEGGIRVYLRTIMWGVRSTILPRSIPKCLLQKIVF